MSTKTYEAYAKRYETTTPIRGRNADVRPIGQRRRDWETITKKALDEGIYSVSAKLYQTECVEYLPNGDIILRCGSWPTPTTAEFIHTHSPFSCWKQGGKLWIRVGTNAIPLNAELRMNWKGEHKYEPAEKVIINKRVVDRDKAKAAREPFKPFLEYAKAMLVLSDGWVMHETRKQVLGWRGDKPENYTYAMDTIGDGDLYDVLTAPQQEIDTDHLHLQLLCRMNMVHIMENEVRRDSEKFTYTVQFGDNQSYTRNREFYDYKIDFEKLKRKVYSAVDAKGDVYKVVQVEPTNKGMYGTV
jgi:hypothetical protein